MPSWACNLFWSIAITILIAGCALHNEASITGTGLETAPPGWSLGLPEGIRPDYNKPGQIQTWLFGDDAGTDERITPWFTQAIGQHDGQWHIAAGKRSGIRLGDVLEVYEPGRLAKSPSGRPAGWIPGRLKGKLQVVAFLGSDSAIAVLIEGIGPMPEDHLLMAADNDTAE